MIADTLFINEAYFKKVISHLRSIDGNMIISTVRLIQTTDLVNVITNTVYDNIETKLKNSDPFTPAEQKLFEDIQMFLAVKAALELAHSAPIKLDDSIRDTAHLAYRSKASLLEARMVRTIKNDSTLLSEAVSDSQEFDDNEMDIQVGFYFDS